MRLNHNCIQRIYEEESPRTGSVAYSCEPMDRRLD